MWEGWLWLSILKTAACPSPRSTTPAFSPGPWITCGPEVGSFLSQTLEDLYEQCSDHITEKMPSSVSRGSRPSASTSRRYSSGERPCSAIMSGATPSCFRAVSATERSVGEALRMGHQPKHGPGRVVDAGDVIARAIGICSRCDRPSRVAIAEGNEAFAFEPLQRLVI